MIVITLNKDNKMGNNRSTNQAILSIIHPKTKTKTILFKDALNFAKENGYIFAVYEKQDNNYVLKDDAYLSDIYENENIIVKIVGSGIDFKEFITEDKNYCFRLHNNFNVPKIIPIFNI